MKLKLYSSLFILITFLLFTRCNRKKEIYIQNVGNEVVAFRALPFMLKDVKLLDGPFKTSLELNIKSLLKYEPDRFLAGFRAEAGLIPKAEKYHGWEDMTIAGHSLGHFLSACALMYQSTGDTGFLERVNYMVSELDSCQLADSNGYIGAIPDEKRILEEEVAKGEIISSGFNLNGLWSPFYTCHKVMAGLRDAYHLCENYKALEIEKKFADWIGTIVQNLPDSSIQQMLRCEYGGINEVLADLYGDTKNQKYLTLAMKFYDKAILDSLQAGIDILPGKHANTQIPKIIGLARQYELTGDSSDRNTAEFFWERVVHHHSYVTGGNGNYEYFGQPDRLRNRLGPNTTESCNVYNMLKLTTHIFMWNASAEAAEYYERAMLNHIHASQHPMDGRVIYNLSLDMGGIKEFQDPFGFTCCVGTGMESHSKYESDIYFRNDEELFINQFIASELTWKDKGIVLRQETKFPDEQGTSFFLRCENPTKLTFQLRYPSWAKNDMEIRINGKKHHIKQKPGSYIAMNRTWEDSDKIEVKFPFSLRLEAMPDDNNKVAIFYGPVLMAGELGPKDDLNVNDLLYVPVFVTSDRDPTDWTEPVIGKTNQFLTRNVGRPRDVLLRPFYSIYDKHYSVYWDLKDESGWRSLESIYHIYTARRRDIEDKTIDQVMTGDSISEYGHNLKNENSRSGTFKERLYRESREGWFSYQLKTLPGKTVALDVDYFIGLPGTKKFDILINNKLLISEDILYREENRFIDVQYIIPQELLKNQKSITVKFLAHQNSTAGPIFGVRVIRL